LVSQRQGPPDVQIEVGDETLEVTANEVHGLERDALFERQAGLFPGFGGYQRQTKRTIPVVSLTRRIGDRTVDLGELRWP
jgi:F420H(2)-dependent quinone reductase